ncbi:interleukin-10 receptor subunit beta-like [Genypterus blacodes]|uniref:interleukin-10 receptor subunit beta-like n=1 Tax=Genypterus blacodes TaxID=154954 RepID=UPI003F75B4CE
MSASTSILILLSSALCVGKGASRALSAPTRVRLTSYNMDLVLRWDAPEDSSGLSYETQYNTTQSKYRGGCVKSSALTCDLTSLHGSITVYGMYTGRVRALRGSESSDWVESQQITMDRNTVIGPPFVSLISNGASIEASIKDPVFRISDLRAVYNYATYNITYWKKGQQEKARSIENLQQNRVVLHMLEPWTHYCVQVQIHTKQNPSPSEPSSSVCESTADEEESPWVAAVVTFVVMAMVVAMVVVAVVYRKRLSNFLCPQDSLQQYLKEYLMEPPTSSIFLDMRTSPPQEEVFHPVSIVTDSRAEEEQHPPEAGEANCAGRAEHTEKGTR